MRRIEIEVSKEELYTMQLKLKTMMRANQVAVLTPVSNVPKASKVPNGFQYKNCLTLLGETRCSRLKANI